tara:strand:+ start:1201 stop:1863 length:663 start_codon:yes stop_codon:yes gene_type:complete
MSNSNRKIPVEHRANRRILSLIAKGLLGLSNWRINGNIPNFPKVIVIGAPHSAYIDAYYVLLAVLVLDVKVKFLAAQWVFSHLPISSQKNDKDNLDDFGIKWPFGWLQRIIVKRLGGIPVTRTRSTGLVNSLIERLRKMNHFLLMLAPEGGMLPQKTFKTGFYVISKNLDVPILPIQFDFQNRCFNLLEPYFLTGNIENDMKELRKLFHGVKGKNHTFIA